jgi:hypothetical protein
MFSKTIFSFGKTKQCPHCHKGIQSYINLKIAALVLLPFLGLSLFVLKPLFTSLGLSGAGATGILATLLLLFSTRLKSAE